MNTVVRGHGQFRFEVIPDKRVVRRRRQVTREGGGLEKSATKKISKDSPIQNSA